MISPLIDPNFWTFESLLVQYKYGIKNTIMKGDDCNA